MLNKVDLTIDGLEVSTVQLPAMRAHRLFWRLGKVAPYVAARVDLFKLDWSSVEGMAPALLELFGRLSVEESEALMREILAGTSVTMDGKSISLDRVEMIDHVFSGKLPALYSVVAFALVVNYKDFIPGGLASQASPPTDEQPGAVPA